MWDKPTSSPSKMMSVHKYKTSDRVMLIDQQKFLSTMYVWYQMSDYVGIVDDYYPEYDSYIVAFKDGRGDDSLLFYYREWELEFAPTAEAWYAQPMSVTMGNSKIF